MHYLVVDLVEVVGSVDVVVGLVVVGSVDAVVGSVNVVVGSVVVVGSGDDLRLKCIMNKI